MDAEENKNVTQNIPADEKNTTVLKEQEEALEAAVEQAQQEGSTPSLSVSSILKALSKAVRNGDIKSQQAQQIRSDLGILNSFFTKKTTSVKAKRKKRLTQKKAHKVTIRNGYKGQKMDKGKKR